MPLPPAGERLDTTLMVPAGDDAGETALPLLIVRGLRDGPVVAVLGGVHGDEYEGVVAAGQLWRRVEPHDLAGVVIIVPIANPPAYVAGSRTSPVDGLNLARTFPGRPDGTVSERIAHCLTERIIRRVDFLIDLHSAGRHYAMPLLCGGYAGDNELGRRCMAAAAAFGAPVLWAHPVVAPGRTLSAALDAGVPCVYAECDGGGEVRASDVAAYVDGVCGILGHLGALAVKGAPARPQFRLRDTGNTDEALPVSCAGLLVTHVRPLDLVKAGQPLADVVDERGALVETLRAPHAGVIMMARRTARVQPGDGAYLLGKADA